MSGWKEWASRCLRAMDAAKIDGEDERLALALVVKAGHEPYWTLKAYAVRELAMEDEP